MFNLGFTEIILLFVIGLLVLGPKQLPQVARVLGRLAKEFKSAIGDFNSEIEKTTSDFKKESRNISKQINSSHKKTENKKDESGTT